MTTKRNWNEPIPGQAAAIVQGPRGAYLARFPYDVAGGRDRAISAAKDWRATHAPKAAVLGFTGRTELVFDYSDGVKAYTAFVRQTNGQGTTWIQGVQGRDLTEAGLQAETDCAADWGCSPSEVECIGLAEGSVNIAMWEDGE